MDNAQQFTFFKDDPLWFKDAIIYEVPVRAFADSDGDGIGDFRGLAEKLDYIQDLGVTAIWLLPFFPSPLRDDGYDIADYNSVNPIYGNLDDFKEFLQAAHQRGLRVIIELIVNHTSDLHPWFQRARLAPPGSREREFYVWNDSPDKYQGVRIIFKDFEPSNWSWDPIAQAYYWHRFYSHQPDLNFEHPELKKALFDVVDFWLAMGVDGMRLDAVPYLYEEEGTNCENLPRTHVFLQDLRSHIDTHFPNRMLLAEANQWPEDAAAYYGQGDECHMNFHFPLMPRLFMSLQMEDSFPIMDILQQTPAIPSNCQWALFLRNHDELTLEMVSDEDRDYMYKVYAQDPQARINLGIRRRLAPLMGNNRRRIELMNSLLLSLPGTPVIYYGDEIGMGDNFYLGDRNGVRTPMQWSADRNAGFSRANPQKLYAPIIVDPEYNYETVNVEAQRANPSSLWWWMKRLIAVRSKNQAFGRGTFELLYPENRKVLAFVRMYNGEHILVVANLSRFVQTVELDLSAFKGLTPVEIFGRTEFPTIDESPYFLSLGPHAFFWFTLQLQPKAQPLFTPSGRIPTIVINGRWQEVYTKADAKRELAEVLPTYLCRCRWFDNQCRIVQEVEILDAIPIAPSSASASSSSASSAKASEKLFHTVLVKANCTEGIPENYVLHLAGEAAADESSPHDENAIAYLRGQDGSGVLYDALADEDYLMLLLNAIARNTQLQGYHGTLNATPLMDIHYQPTDTPHVLRVDRSNSLVVYGGTEAAPQEIRFILKLFRQVDYCINPDLEIGQFLTKTSQTIGVPHPDNFPTTAGALEYRQRNLDPMTIGLLQRYFLDTRDAWSYTLDSLRDLFELVMVRQDDLGEIVLPPENLSEALTVEVPQLAYEVMGTYLTMAELLGQRTAEMHLALASNPVDAQFAPEAFNSFYQRSVYQYMRNQAGQTILRLRKEMKSLTPELQAETQLLLNHQETLMERYKRIIDLKITALRTRCHGNFHLEEILYTGKDFVIIDYEGEVTRPMSERRMKRSPLRDIAGMLQSFYYASRTALQREIESGLIRPEAEPIVQQWAQFFYTWSSVVYVKQYLATAADAAFVPQTLEELQVLLTAYLLERSVHELGYELQNRPQQIGIPLNRILELIEVRKPA